MNGSYNTIPKYHVAVDCVVFGYEDSELKVLLAHRRFEHSKGEWSLVGGWIRDKENAEEASKRILAEVTGLKNIFMEQVKVFSALNRDPGGRVISIVYYAMINIVKHDKKLVDKNGAQWWPFQSRPNLIFDHNEMVQEAHLKLKNKAGYDLIGKDLLPKKFTLLEVRNLYNAVFQMEFDPGNFRKKILSLNVLERLTTKNTKDSRKGAYYYSFGDKKENVIKERIVK